MRRSSSEWLKCVYCHSRTSKQNQGACIQCSFENCSTSFHVTCAHIAGVVMKPADWPYLVAVTCHKHRNTNPKPKTVPKGPKGPSLGQKVIGRNSDGWFYHCTVIGVATQTFYEVNYDDGSYCDNLHPENIISHDCLRNGPPEVGELMVVHTTEGQTLNASFVREHIHRLYQVEFQDQSQLLLKHTEIHPLEQELPKRVRARLAIPVHDAQEAASGDGAQAAKRRCLPSAPAPAPPQYPQTPMETTDQPACLPSTAPAQTPALTPAPVPSHHSVTAPTPQPLSSPDAAPKDPSVPADGTRMDTDSHMGTSSALNAALTESALATDPTLTSATALFQSPLNSDPLLSTLEPPPHPQHLSDGYTPSSGYVSYMENLLSSHFPQDEGPGPMF
ncbi:lysine-specific demethylase 4B-like [Polymixia lowei]